MIIGLIFKVAFLISSQTIVQAQDKKPLLIVSCAQHVQSTSGTPEVCYAKVTGLAHIYLMIGREVWFTQRIASEPSLLELVGIHELGYLRFFDMNERRKAVIMQLGADKIEILMKNGKLLQASNFQPR